MSRYSETTPNQLEQHIYGILNDFARLSPDEIEEYLKEGVEGANSQISNEQLFNQFLTKAMGMQCVFRQPAGNNTNFDLLITVSDDDELTHTTDIRFKAPKSVLEFLKIPITPERPFFRPDTETTIAIQLVAYLLGENSTQYFNRILRERLLKDFDPIKLSVSIREEAQKQGIYPATAEKYLGL